MRKITLICFLLICIMGISCNNTISNKEAKSKLEELLQISISDSIEVTDHNEDVSIQGDQTETFVAHFNAKEFNMIFRKINPTKFKNINANIYGYTVNKDRETISAIFDPEKNTIKYTYNYE